MSCIICSLHFPFILFLKREGIHKGANTFSRILLLLERGRTIYRSIHPFSVNQHLFLFRVTQQSLGSKKKSKQFKSSWTMCRSRLKKKMMINCCYLCSYTCPVKTDVSIERGDKDIKEMLLRQAASLKNNVLQACDWLKHHVLQEGHKRTVG